MSDYFVSFIPGDPHFVPSVADQQAAAKLLESVAGNGAEISTQVSDVVAFRDSGSNFERASCPNCCAEIPVGTWQQWMDEDWTEADGFRLSQIRTPCCGTATTLNDLIYEWRQGFSRYQLTVMNPRADVSDDDVRRLEATLRCGLRVIRRHV